jgi:hypothetical protein
MSSFNIDMPADILIRADKLKNSSIQKKQIRENVIEIIRKIDDELRIAHSEGKHLIITDIPIQFSIANMSNKDAQRAIWATTIEALRDKNYRVWINYDDASCRLKITWISDEDELTLKLQNQVLSDCRGNH